MQVRDELYIWRSENVPSSAGSSLKQTIESHRVAKIRENCKKVSIFGRKRKLHVRWSNPEFAFPLTITHFAMVGTDLIAGRPAYMIDLLRPVFSVLISGMRLRQKFAASG